MEIIKHRVNRLDDIDPNLGIEIDVRDYKNEIVLAHDHPNDQCMKLKKFLEEISKNQLIAINVKSSEIELELKEILHDLDISNYFTFDWAFPSLRKALDINITCAFRLSEYEKEIVSNCTWVWIDCFEGIWYDIDFLDSLKRSGLKLAIVSPELHNRESEISKVKDIINSTKIDAICTDRPELW